MASVCVSSTVPHCHVSLRRTSAYVPCAVLHRLSARNSRFGRCRAVRKSSGSEGQQTEDLNGSKDKRENMLLKAAWYASEALGVAVSLFKGQEMPTPVDAADDKDADISIAISREQVVSAIKQDFQSAYFVTGNLTRSIYEKDCEFADPAGSFKGLERFQRNCSNFGYLLEKSNMKLMKWEDFENHGVAHWRFICVLAFPWRPILSATGRTEYFYNSGSGKIHRHVEHWNVPKMVLLKQIFKPNVRLRK